MIQPMVVDSEESLRLASEAEAGKTLVAPSAGTFIEKGTANEKGLPKAKKPAATKPPAQPPSAVQESFQPAPAAPAAPAVPTTSETLIP
jgi:hypothetical protein